MENNKIRQVLGRTQTISAILWAITILIVSFLLRGVEGSHTIFLILVTAAGFQMSLLSSLLDKSKKPKIEVNGA